MPRVVSIIIFMKLVETIEERGGRVLGTNKNNENKENERNKSEF